MHPWQAIEWLFIVLLLASCGYAALAGGRDGRRVAAMIFAAALLSDPAGRLDRAWGGLQLAVFTLDLLLLLGLLIIALRSRAYWPIWATAFHGLSVLTHVATIGQHALRPVAYFALQSFWSIPVLVVMATGIMLDQRRGLNDSAKVRSG